mgnify:CR=1 FL=1
MTARDYLFSLEQFGIKLGLEQIRALLDALDRPDRAFRSVVIAGTNGKGSVTAMTAHALRAAGYRTGRYTSPHLAHIEERIAIDGAPLAPERFDAIADALRSAAAALSAPPTFFEATTAMALEAFRQARVDVAVMEVGMGGRLDATNVLRPEGVAITSVDFDHQQYLGTTLPAIAAEKAGIVKPGRFCVLGRNPPEVRDVVTRTCAERGATLIDATSGIDTRTTIEDGHVRLTLRTPAADYGEVPLGLRGRHQVDNAVTAVRLLEALAASSQLCVPVDAVRAGLRDVVWPGRLEVLHHRGRTVIVDGAHNAAAARALAAYLEETYTRRLPIVLGVMRDKDLEAIVAPLAARASAIVCTSASTPRAAAASALADEVRRLAPGVRAIAVDDPRAALDAAAACGDPIVVAGSLYLAGELRAELS